MSSGTKKLPIANPEKIIAEEQHQQNAPAELPAIDSDLVNTIKKRYQGHIDDDDFTARIAKELSENHLIEAGYIARDWTVICPQAYQAHVRAGEIFMMQGKSRLAVESFERAIAVAPQHTSQLSPKLAEALKQRDKRIDGIAALPWEVAEGIIREIELDDLLTSKTVSRTWRQHISKSRAALEHVILQENYNYEDFEQNLMRIQRCCETIQSQSNNVRQLLIGPEIRSNTVQDLVYSLYSGFRNLQTLGIIVDEFDVDALEASVKKNLRKTLKKILLTFQYGTYKDMDATELFVPVWRLLSKFTTVTHFSFNQHTGVGEGFSQRKLPAFKSLTHLSLKADWLNTNKALAYLKTVCRASPNLLYFSTDCPPNGLSTIRSLLPNLQYLSLNAPYDSFAEDIRDENYKPTDNIGLRTFELYVQTGQDVDPVYALMDESKSTLEELLLLDPNAGDDDLEEWDNEESLDDEVEDWNILSDFSSKQLRKLNLEIKYIGTEAILALLKQCPNLTAVNICNNPQVTDELFDALLQLPKLEHLKLMNNVNLTDEGLESFFNRLAGRDTLKYLHLEDLDDCLSKDALDALANNLNSLTTLVISGKDIHANDLTTVGEKLISLQEVILHLIGGKFHQLSVKLSQLPNLRKLDFTEVAGVDDDDVRILVDGSHSLRKIRLSVCQSITKEGVDYGNKFIVVRNSGWYYS